MSTSSNYQNYVAGEFRASSEYYDVENPATQGLVDRAPVATRCCGPASPEPLNPLLPATKST